MQTTHFPREALLQQDYTIWFLLPFTSKFTIQSVSLFHGQCLYITNIIKKAIIESWSYSSDNHLCLYNHLIITIFIPETLAINLSINSNIWPWVFITFLSKESCTWKLQCLRFVQTAANTTLPKFWFIWPAFFSSPEESLSGECVTVNVNL